MRHSHHRMHHTSVMYDYDYDYYNMLKFINNNDVIKCMCVHIYVWLESSDSKYMYNVYA